MKKKLVQPGDSGIGPRGTQEKKGMAAITPKYSTFSRRDYEQKINSPSKSKDYFKKFHLPLLEHASQHSDRPIVLDIACGHAHELQFFDPSQTVLIGIDVSGPTLSAAKRRLPEVSFIKADVRDFKLPGCADVALAVNAVVYVPDLMVSTLADSLSPHGRASINFRDVKNPHNKPFYDHYLKDGASISPFILEVGREKFTLQVLDYRECGDEKIRSLDRQMYFQGVDDMVRFLEISGLRIISHTPFHFSSPVNPDNEIDVFILERHSP